LVVADGTMLTWVPAAQVAQVAQLVSLLWAVYVPDAQPVQFRSVVVDGVLLR
jgi:hypothetical protein